MSRNMLQQIVFITSNTTAHIKANYCCVYLYRVPAWDDHDCKQKQPGRKGWALPNHPQLIANSSSHPLLKVCLPYNKAEVQQEGFWKGEFGDPEDYLHFEGDYKVYTLERHLLFVHYQDPIKFALGKEQAQQLEQDVNAAVQCVIDVRCLFGKLFVSTDCYASDSRSDQSQHKRQSPRALRRPSHFSLWY